MLQEMPADCDKALRAAIAVDYPNRTVGRIAICDSTPNELVVRVFFPVPQLRPTPYEIYRIQILKLVAHRLDGHEAAPYAIANYK
jgi:hypothetical protein